MTAHRAPSRRIATIVLFVVVTWISARASAQTVPEPTPLGAWDGGETQLAQLEARIAELHREERSHEAMELLEHAARENLVRDPDAAERLIHATKSLAVPGSDPGWFYVGVPLLVVGGAGVILTGMVHGLYINCPFSSSCTEPELAPYLAAYVTAGVFFIAGVVLTIVGFDTNDFDPERREYLERRRGVLRVFVDVRRGVGLSW